MERLKIRISFLYGRPVRELEETMGHDEWADLVCFHGNYDLPDSFIVAGRLGELISGIMGGKAKAEDFVPYYKAEKKPGDGVKGAFQFLRSMGYGKKRKPR